MAKTQSTEVANVEPKALALVPDFMDAADFGGVGFEGTDKDSFAIPFIQILQKMSPLVDEDSPKHIEGAKAGMLYNTVSQKLYDGKAGIVIIPCAYKRSFIQWGGREGDGGFKGEFTPEQFAEFETDPKRVQYVEGRPFVPNEDGSVHEKKSDYFADTRSHFVLVVDENGDYSQAILSLASSQIKASKALMTSLQQKKVDTPKGKMTPPTFANKVKLTTIGLSNDQGNWSGAKFELDGLVTDGALYAAAKEFYKVIISGEAKVDYSKADPAANGDVENGTPKTAEGF